MRFFLNFRFGRIEVFDKNIVIEFGKKMEDITIFFLGERVVFFSKLFESYRRVFCFDSIVFFVVNI